MQNSSEFQYIAIDTIHESATNPRKTFDECKLGVLGVACYRKRSFPRVRASIYMVGS